MPRTSRKVEVHVSSYTKGGQFETKRAEKLSEIYEEYNVDASEAIVELTGEDGEERRALPSAKLEAGDTIIIMKSKNKSGI